MKAIIKIFIALTILLSMPFTTQAGWVGPEELVTGTWGSGEGQFFFGYGDAEDVFPREFGVDRSGRIFMNDKLNTRIQTYAKDGVLKKIINAPQGINSAFGWPYNIYIYSDGSIVASYEGPQKFFYDSAGNLVRKIDVYGAAHPTPQGYYFEVSKTQYILYSSTGQFIKMMD